MNMTAAIVLLEAAHDRIAVGGNVRIPERDVLALKELTRSLKMHGFSQLMFLIADDAGDVPKELPNPSVSFSAPGFELPTVVRRIHPAFISEVAIHEATCDWVFIFWFGEKIGASHIIRDAVCTADSNIVELPTTDGPEVRGFFRRGDAQPRAKIARLKGPTIDVAGRTLVNGALPDLQFKYDISVIVPAWRLGGLDVTMEALTRQMLPNSKYEVILVDALYEWRKGTVMRQLACCYEGMNVEYVPCDDAVFPLSSHSRFRNTAIRRAKGKRLVFLCEYACPPPEFLQAHVDLARDAIGVSPWVRTQLEPRIVAYKHDPEFVEAPKVWDIIEMAQTSDKFHWSIFRGTSNPLRDCIEHEKLNGIKPPRYPDTPNLPDDYVSHWKSESVDASLVQLINGWDETFDGSGDYADTDFTLRLKWAGAHHQYVDMPVRVLDPHEISVAPLEDLTRNNGARLQQVRERRAIRCVHGAVPGILDRRIRHINEKF